MKEVNKPIIGILGVPAYDNEGSRIIAITNSCKNAIISKGCIPLVIFPLLNIDYCNKKLNDIPNLTEEEEKIYKEMVDMCDGIIIPGGNRMYNFDYFVAKYAIEKDIPLIGICLGMQLLANIDNEEYCLQLNNTNINHANSNADYVHKVKIVDNTLLGQIIGEKEITVNSNHKYNVSKINNYIVSAYSEDGLIEAIEMHNKRFVIGIQWHPEKLLEHDINSNKLFDRFVSECITTKSTNNNI